MIRCTFQPVNALDLPAMKLSLHLASLVLARLWKGLHFLKEALRRSVPRQEPLLVPIPIQAGRRTRQTSRRHRDRND